MASLRRLPNSPYWIACFTLPDGRRTQRSTKATDRREAQRIANKFEDVAETGREQRLTETQARKVIADIFSISNKDVLPSSSVKDYLESWLKRKELEASEPTHQRYKTVVDHLVKFLGAKAGLDITHLNSKEITGFRDHLANRFTSGTVNISLKILRSALAQAKRDGLTDVNEAERVTMIRVKAREQSRRPFTLGELKQIMKVANDEWRGLILMGLYTGLRLSDVATLTWANVDLQEQEIRVVSGKTDRQQILPVARVLLKHLESLPSSDDPNGPLFPDAYAARQRSQYGGTLSNQFHQILVSAGLVKKRPHTKAGEGRSAKRAPSELSFHSLRHTATSLLKNAGVSDAVARDIIGHESVAVSRNYTHIDTATKRKAVDKMPDILLGK
jgi:integrase